MVEPDAGVSGDGATELRQAAARLASVPLNDRYGSFAQDVAAYITHMLLVTQPPAAGGRPPSTSAGPQE